MKLIKPKFWVDTNILSFLLIPLTSITYLINSISKKYPKKKFNIKTICIGNIFIGGTGKTSLTIELSKIIKNKIKHVIIKKGYYNQLDEINLLKMYGTVISKMNRINSLQIAENKKFQLALLDDGLQQKNIVYDLKIVCFNSDDGYGNGFLLPAGPLRESLNEVKNYDLAFLIGERKNVKLYKKIKYINKNIKIFEARYQAINLKKLNRTKKYLMFCGIGNPHEFKKTLLKNKFSIKREIIYPDHYKIPINEINNIKKLAKKDKLNIITTEKDYFRLNKKQKKGIKFLKVKLKINNVNKLQKILFNINEEN
tara:strand:+ start:2738 stop:3670 length:933 start_codon:yes stop_codon:yes gene_type:complete